jgi:membrane-bound inhibitor of C-type lysozyme
MKTIHTLFLMLLFAANVSAQSILTVNPKEGRRNTNTWLDIQGSNTRFTESSDIAVSLVSNVDGSVLVATNAYASSDTYCYAELRIPATATPGWYTIKVATTNEGILSKANVYRVTNEPPLPELIGITPSSAINGQTITTKITARYAKFLSSSSFVVTLSGGTTQLGATSAIALNDTTIQATFTIPSNNRSDVCGVILITDNDYLYLPQAFSISGIDPEITFISPNSASDGDQLDITIKTTKTELLSIASTINVTLKGDWNYLNATAVTVINDTVLTASFDIPERAHSDVCNVLVNADGMIVKSQAFTINGINPEVFDVSPAEAEQGTTLDVTISGADMFFTQSSNVNISFYGVNGGSFQGASMVVMNDNQLKTTISIPKNAPVGMYSLNMWVAGNNLNLTEAFNVVEDGLPDPALVSISPAEASRGQVLDVTITGSGTNFTQSSNLVVYISGGGYYQATSVTIMNDTKLRCTFNIPSNAQMGWYSVYVNDNVGSYLTLLDGFRIAGNAASDPVLVSISPAMTFPGHSLM